MLYTGHVNNVTYNRYAESARVNWAQKYATHIDPAHKKEWSELCTPRGIGLILRSIKTDYKFVSVGNAQLSCSYAMEERGFPFFFFADGANDNA